MLPMTRECNRVAVDRELVVYAALSSEPTASTHLDRCDCSSCSCGSSPPVGSLFPRHCCPKEPRRTTGTSVVHCRTLPSVLKDDSHRHAPTVHSPVWTDVIPILQHACRTRPPRVFPFARATSWRRGTHRLTDARMISTPDDLHASR